MEPDLDILYIYEQPTRQHAEAAIDSQSVRATKRLVQTSSNTAFLFAQ